MIRQQRELLKRTFTLREMQTASTSQIDRLVETQQGILTATEEFTAGIRERAGDVPPLNDAIADMQAATAALIATLLDHGQEMEKSALANLTRARQNLRNILKQSDSSQASQCRSFDRQQQQKLRMPEREQEPEDQRSQQLAQACEQLEQLAEQQQQWSQQACPSSHSPSTSASQPSSQQLAQEQQSAIQQAQQINDDLQQSQRGGELAEQEMEQAKEDMQEALDQLTAGQNEDASEAAAQAAERLRQLAEHLKTLSEPDFAKKLARASNLAQQLADHQHQLAREAGRTRPDGTVGQAPPDASADQSSPATPEQRADQQHRLADRAEQLDELTARLAAESLEQDAETHRMIQDARQASPPGETAELMRETAEDYGRERDSQAIRSAEVATRSLNQLAGDLRRAHEQLTQPKLEQLITAEEQAAQLLRELLESRNEAERALARAKLDELDQTLDPLAAGDQRLAQAQDSMRGRGDQDFTRTDNDGQRPSGMFRQAGETNSTPEARFDESDQVLVAGLREVTGALQAMIQEAILDRALLAPDDAVPPGYEKMVEEYYRALSEDLR